MQSHDKSGASETGKKQESRKPEGQAQTGSKEGQASKQPHAEPSERASGNR